MDPFWQAGETAGIGYVINHNNTLWREGVWLVIDACVRLVIEREHREGGRRKGERERERERERVLALAPL